MLLFIQAVLFLHFSVQWLHPICFPSPTYCSSCKLTFVEFSPHHSLFYSLVGISRREAENCHRIRHFENTFVVETVICKKSWGCCPVVTFLGFACTHMLSALFLDMVMCLTFFFLIFIFTPSLACEALTSWVHRGLTADYLFLPPAYLRHFTGLKFTQWSQIAWEWMQPLPCHRTEISFGSRLGVEGMAKK